MKTKGMYSRVATRYVKTLLSLRNKNLSPEEIELLERFKNRVESDIVFDFLVKYIRGNYGILFKTLEP